MYWTNQPPHSAIKDADFSEAVSNVFQLLQRTVHQFRPSSQQQSPTSFPCDLCDKTFDTEKGLKTHKRLMHNVTSKALISARSCSLDGMQVLSSLLSAVAGNGAPR